MYMNVKSTIFTKRTLLEAVGQVVGEAGVQDVLSNQWHKDTTREMDNEFYRENAAAFWDDMQHWIQVLQSAPENEQKEWAYDAGWDSDVVANIPHFLKHTIDFNWVRDKITDKQVYSMMKNGTAQVDKALKELLTKSIF